MFSLTDWSRNCSGWSRRAFLQVGSLPLFGLSLPRMLAAEQHGAANSSQPLNCILLWTNGGIANMDTFDMKPDAPLEYRGEFRPIDTNLPGVQVCEHLPRMSRLMDLICQVRTIEHSGSQHAEASHFMLTGYPQIPDVNAAPVGSTIYPSFGSLVSKELGWQRGMPPYVKFSGKSMAYSGAGYLGSAYNALEVAADPNAADFTVQDVSIPAAVGPERTERRRTMLGKLDAWQRAIDQSSGSVFDRSQFTRQAYDLITSPSAKQAFQIDQEPAVVRDAYGRNREGQCMLMTRRLIEAGVRFVAVDLGGYDTHNDNFKTLKNLRLPVLDQGWSALLTDMRQRGLLDNTVVLCAGEFGRTPKVNGAAGRDHWPLANVIMLSGAKVKMGTIVGKTDSRCERVFGKANSTIDYAATMFELLGIDGTKEYHAADGRPIQVNNGGVPIDGVIA
jgi:hypothetical protein